nr:MAG: ORF2 [Giant panda anellovirus]
MGKPEEEIWIENIRLSHCLFCNCPSWKDHLQRLWCDGPEDTAAEGGDPIPEEVMVAFDLGFEETAGEDTAG